MTAPGLLVDGQLVATPCVTVIPPATHGGPSWNLLHTDDYTARQLPVSLLVLHTTGGHWPQPILPGAGQPGHARQTLEDWSGANRGGGERVHAGSQLLVDYDGTVYCCADIVRCSSYSAQMINHRSVSIEMCTLPDGSIYEATLDAGARLTALLTHSGLPGAGILPIPAQMPRGPYRGQPIRRLELAGQQTDGRGVVGVIGHCHQTAHRNEGDPGRRIWELLAALGCEGLDYDGMEDIELGQRRQAVLVSRGESLVVDGVCGPASLRAMHRQGWTRWRDVGAAERG